MEETERVLQAIADIKADRSAEARIKERELFAELEEVDPGGINRWIMYSEAAG